MCSSSDQPTTVEITNFLCSEEVGLALKFPAPRPVRPSWVGNRSLSFVPLSAADSTLVGHHRFTKFASLSSIRLYMELMTVSLECFNKEHLIGSVAPRRRTAQKSQVGSSTYALQKREVRGETGREGTEGEEKGHEDCKISKHNDDVN